MVWKLRFADMTTQVAFPALGEDPVRPAINTQTSATFKTSDAKLYVPFATLSIQGDSKLLQQLKTGFKWTIKWKKYKLKMSSQAKSNNLNYLVDPLFIEVNEHYLCYSLKMKMIEFLLKNTIHQTLKEKTSTCELTVQAILTFL